MTTPQSYELFTLEVDFIVKHPFQLPPAPENFDPGYYAAPLKRLRDARTILTATDWARSSNSKSFRPTDEKDAEALRRSAAAVHAHIHQVLLPGILAESEYIILSETMVDARFACVSGRVKIMLAAGGIAATLLAGITGAAATAYFDRPNLSTDCSAHMSSPETVSHNLETQLELHNPTLFDPHNKSCVILRQRMLSFAEMEPGPVDGIYRDGTSLAEQRYARAHGLPASDLEQIYRHLSENLREKPSPRVRLRSASGRP